MKNIETILEILEFLDSNVGNLITDGDIFEKFQDRELEEIQALIKILGDANLIKVNYEQLEITFEGILFLFEMKG